MSDWKGDRDANGKSVGGQAVSLGLGTLVLIAVMVMFFSNRSVKKGLTPMLEKLDAVEERLERIERRLEGPGTQPSPPAVAARPSEQ